MRSHPRLSLQMRGNKIVSLVLLSLLIFTPALSQSDETSSSSSMMGRRVSKTLKFLSPLQSLTLFPKDIPTATPRQKFLPKFQAGITAEKKIQDRIAKEREDANGDGNECVDEGWDKKMEESDRLSAEGDDQRMEIAFDSATTDGTTNPILLASTVEDQNLKRSKYQFVGIVQPEGSPDDKKIKWFARRRPLDSKWNLRVLHVNREAIVQDLFTRGKVDIYGEYKNTGTKSVVTEEGAAESSKPLIMSKYSVKKRMWWNLWNFNAKHLFTDSAGAFWRERRVSPGFYTDGLTVYEATYRYSDGKNTMKPVARLVTFLDSNTVKEKDKNKLLKRLKEDSPDVVMEE